MNIRRPKEEILKKSKAKGWILLGLDYRVEKQLGNTLVIEIIESFGHMKIFGKMIEIRCAIREHVEANFL